MLKKILITPALMSFLIFITCDENLTESGNNNPGRRDYTWNVDTLANIAPNNDYTSIWGSSTNDVWAVGNSGSPDKTILHFDGKKWSVFNYRPPGEWIYAWSIFGLSKNDFWIGVESGNFFRLQDGKIKKYGPYVLNDFQDLAVSKFWATDKNDIYAVGNSYTPVKNRAYAFLMHFDGNDWRYLIEPGLEGNFYDIKRGIKDSKSYFLLRWKISDYDSVGIYEYNGTDLKELRYDNWGYKPALFEANDRIYFYFDQKLHRYYDEEFIVLKDLSGSDITGMKIFGRNINDFFISTTDGIGHYNGDNIETVYKSDEQIWIFDAAVFSDEVFFIVCDKTYSHFFIVHGILK